MKTNWKKRNKKDADDHTQMKRKKTINQIKCNSNNGTSSSSSYPTAARHAIELRVCNVHIDFSILLARTAGERERETAKQSKCMCACRVCICLFLFVSFTHFYLHFIRRFAACHMHGKKHNPTFI